MSHTPVTPPPGAPGQPASARWPLSLMMFLEFFIWGAWLPIISLYLNRLEFTGSEKGWVLNTFAISALVGMFFSNQFADRNFAAERFLAGSHLIGGLAMLGLTWVHSFGWFFALMLVHCLCYVPTISITNSIAFSNLRDPQKEFGPVRLWGTIGWIAASWPFIFILIDWDKLPAMADVGFGAWLGAALGTAKTGDAWMTAVSWAFIVAGGASLILAGFSLWLPHTPPKPAAHAGDSFAWLEAAKMLRRPFLLVLFLVTFVDAVVHSTFYVLAPPYFNKVGITSNWIPAVLSIGQIAEIGTMAILGLVIKRIGWRTTMIIGILGHAVRFGVFAFFDVPALAISINVLHGICYAFFFATVYIFVDEFFPKDARSSAQGLFNVMILGLGPFVGTYVATWIEKAFTLGNEPDFAKIFLFPSGAALVAAVLMFAFFHPPRTGDSSQA